MMLSLLVPVLDEADILEANLRRLHAFMRKQRFRWEIIVCDNGSTDGTGDVAKRLARTLKAVRYARDNRRGIAHGLRAGARIARGDAMMFYPIDMSFGTGIIARSADALSRWDVALGSKGHRESEVDRSATRNFLSRSYNALADLLFGLGISDTQGTLAFRRDCARFLKFAGDDNVLFQLKFLWDAKRAGKRITELPVAVSDRRLDSRINVLGSAALVPRMLAMRFG